MTKTLDQLIRLEELAFETGLRHEALEIEFQKREANRKPVPLYVHRSGHLTRFFLGVYDELNGSLEHRTGKGLPPFNEWIDERYPGLRDFLRKNDL